MHLFIIHDADPKVQAVKRTDKLTWVNQCNGLYMKGSKPALDFFSFYMFRK